MEDIYRVSLNQNKAKNITAITFPSTLFSIYIFSRSFIDYKISFYESFLYILPFLFVFSIFSNYLLSFFLEAKNDEKEKYKWLFIGSKSKQDFLKKYCPKSFVKSISSLREWFLIRQGILTENDNSYLINVNKKPQDLLLKDLPELMM